MTTSGSIGLTALPDCDRVNFARLRADRRRRLFDAMADGDVDVLMLGRPSNIVFASGARQLWVAGTRPFGPGAVVVRESGRVHLLSIGDEGVPAEIDHEDLYGLSWNPVNLMASLAAIPGLAEARRVGTDSLSPGFAHFVAAVAAHAQVVDGSGIMRAARAVKSVDELACIQMATAVAEAGLEALVTALHPGVRERDLIGVYLARIAELGLPTPPAEGVVCATSCHEAPVLRQLAADRRVAPGELVVCNPGAMFAGYEGGVGRTWRAGNGHGSDAQVELAARCVGGVRAVTAACVPGATGADLRRAWEEEGLVMPPVPLAHGLGLGVEPPVVASGVGDGAVLRAGMVLAIQGWVGEHGAGGYLQRDVVAVGEGGPQVLSVAVHGPLTRA